MPAALVIRAALASYLTAGDEATLPFVALGRSGFYDSARTFGEVLTAE